MRPSTFTGVAIAVLAFASLTPPAVAQSSVNATTPSWAVQEVVVTGRRTAYAAPEALSATRTATPLLETPQSVQVLTRTLIEEQDRRTLADALANVSGVTPAKPEEAVLTEPIIRGFPAEIYIDGLPAFGLTAVIDPTSLVGAERIEVVKGPTSTVNGGGDGAPLGGVINVVSKDPERQPGGFVALRGGSFGTIDPFLDLNTPLTANGDIRARVTAEYERADHWIDRMEREKWSFQPALAFTLGPHTELVLRGQADHRDQLEYSGVPGAPALAGQIDRDAFPGATDQPRTTIDNRLVTADLRHGFTDTITGRLTARYYDSDFKEYGSFIFPAFYPPKAATPTTYPLLSAYLPTKVKEGDVDGNLAAKVDALGGRHELLAGFDYDRTSYDAAIGFMFSPIGAIDLAHPRYTVPFGAIPKLTTTETDNYETIAGYVQDQATYGSLHLLGSLRYTRLGFNQRELSTDRTYYRLTPRVGATLDIAEGVSLFAGYAEGFRGEVNFIGTTPPVPETSRNYEAGLKVARKDTGLSGTLAAFQLDRDHVAAANPAVPFTSIQTGEQRARGVEADVVWEPIRALSVLANYAYTDAAIAKDTTFPVGDRLPRVPRNSGRLAVRYRFLDGALKGLGLGVGVTGVSDRDITLPNSVRVPGYAVADAQASYDFDRFSVLVSVANLTGVGAFDPYQYLNQAVVIPIQPRSAFVTLKTRF